jgi:zinc transport system permease protein
MDFLIEYYLTTMEIEMWDALHFEFMRNAVLSGIIVSIICGILGTLIVVNRIVFLSGGIAHAAYGGIGIAVYTGISPYLGAGAFSFLVSILMGLISLRHRERADTIIGIMWAVGMAIGIILIDLTPGYNVDVMGYLFGSIMSVSLSDILFMFILLVVVFIIVKVFYKEFLALSYDEEFAFVVGVPVKLLYLMLLGMIGLSVVIIIRIVGLILVIAFLTIPPYIAEKFTSSLSKMMTLSSLLGILFSLMGLWLSYKYDITAGATVILISGVAFFLFLGMDIIKSRPPSEGSPRGSS